MDLIYGFCHLNSFTPRSQSGAKFKLQNNTTWKYTVLANSFHLNGQTLECYPSIFIIKAVKLESQDVHAWPQPQTISRWNHTDWQKYIILTNLFHVWSLIIIFRYFSFPIQYFTCFLGQGHFKDITSFEIVDVLWCLSWSCKEHTSFLLLS